MNFVCLKLKWFWAKRLQFHFHETVENVHTFCYKCEHCHKNALRAKPVTSHYNPHNLLLVTL